MPTETLRLKLTERARRAQHLSHLSPAVLLILLGLEALMGIEHEHRVIALLGLAAGIALLIAMRHEFRRKQHSHSRVGWFDVIAGVVIILEGAHMHHPGRWFQPGTLTMILGVIVVFVGIFHQRLPKLRRLVCTESGLLLRVRPFVWLSLPWEQVEGIELQNNRLVVQVAGGGLRTVNLRRIENRAEAAEMMKGYWETSREQAALQ
jgi:hypothetical protein